MPAKRATKKKDDGVARPQTTNRARKPIVLRPSAPLERQRFTYKAMLRAVELGMAHGYFFAIAEHISEENPFAEYDPLDPNPQIWLDKVTDNLSGLKDMGVDAPASVVVEAKKTQRYQRGELAEFVAPVTKRVRKHRARKKKR